MSPPHFQTRWIPSRSPLTLSILLFPSLSTLLSSPSSSSSSSLVYAQQTPVPVRCPQYLSVDEKTLYIQGGNRVLGNLYSTLNQFVSLDLTTPWIDSNPSWHTMPKGEDKNVSPEEVFQSATLSPDQQTLIFWNNTDAVDGSISTFNLQSQTWQSPIPNPVGINKMNGLIALTDPGSGNIYIPNGANATTPNGPRSMFVYNPTTKSLNTLPMPGAPMPMAVSYYSMVWSTALNSMLLYGGTVTSTLSPSPYMYTFSPSTVKWTLINTTGPSPGDLNAHCMVPIYSGSKMVLFGGVSAKNVPSGGIYVLDLATMGWTQGTPSVSPRRGMACAVSGDYFVAWGGDNRSAVMDSTPLIYNVKLDQWTNHFRADNKSSNVGAIAGGVCGAAVVVLLIAGFLFYRRRGRRNGLDKNYDSRAGSEYDAEDREGDYQRRERQGGEVEDSLMAMPVISSLSANRRHRHSPQLARGGIYRLSRQEEREENEKEGEDSTQYPSSVSFTPRSPTVPNSYQHAQPGSGSPLSPSVTDTLVSTTIFSETSLGATSPDLKAPSPYWANPGPQPRSPQGLPVITENQQPQSIVNDNNSNNNNGTFLPTPQDGGRTLGNVDDLNGPLGSRGRIIAQESSQGHSTNVSNTFARPPSFIPGSPQATPENVLGINSFYVPPPPATAPRPNYTPFVPNTSLPEGGRNARFSSISTTSEKPGADLSMTTPSTPSLAAMTLEHELSEEETDEVKIRRLALIQARLDEERAKVESRIRTSFLPK